MNVHTVHWRGGWARISPWRQRAEVAHLTIAADRPPTTSDVARFVAVVRAHGYDSIVTNALSAANSLAFLDAGFVVRKRLHLLAHDLTDLPPRSPETRRARRSDRTAILALDASAFDGFWRIDGDGFTEAVRATPATRVRVTSGAGGRVSGYAVTGRAGQQGYLQRLAVHPEARKCGIGRTLVVDALSWLRRRASRRALVNTQFDNAAALALYESCGFRRLPVGLSVLGRSL
jgi:ribosomal protein S18 acetylase RimI-like enzyme